MSYIELYRQRHVLTVSGGVILYSDKEALHGLHGCLEIATFPVHEARLPKNLYS